jgi:hypothetical protein
MNVITFHKLLNFKGITIYKLLVKSFSPERNTKEIKHQNQGSRVVRSAL